MDALGPLEVLRSAGKAGAELTARLVTRLPQQVAQARTGCGSSPIRFTCLGRQRDGQAQRPDLAVAGDYAGNRRVALDCKAFGGDGGTF